MLDIPFGAVWLLDAMAIRYQTLFIDGDEVRAFADTVREFGRRVTETNNEGATVVSDLGATSEGASYQGLVSAWNGMSADMPELEDACEFVAQALEAAAVVIEVTQAAVIAELALLGAAFIGSIAASAATFGTSAALSMGARVAANRLISVMEQVLIAYLMNEVLELAIEPLEALVERIVNGYGSGALVEEPGPNNKFRMTPEEWENAANKFDQLGDEMAGHGNWLSGQLSGLFGGGDDIDVGPGPGIAPAPPYGPGAPYVGDPGPQRGLFTPDAPPLTEVGSDRDPPSATPYQPAAAATQSDAHPAASTTASGGPGPGPAGIAGPGPLAGSSSLPGGSADSPALTHPPTDTPWQRPDAVASAAGAQDRTAGLVDTPAHRDGAGAPGGALAHPPAPWAPAGQGAPARSDAGQAAPPGKPSAPGRASPPAPRLARRRNAGRTPWTRDAERVVAAQQDSARVIAPGTTPWQAGAPKVAAKRNPDDKNDAADTTVGPDNVSAGPDAVSAGPDAVSVDPKNADRPPPSAVLAPAAQERAGT